MNDNESGEMQSTYEGTSGTGRIDLKMVTAVATNFANGLSLKHALALVSPASRPITPDVFKRAVQKSGRLSLAWDKTVATILGQDLEQIRNNPKLPTGRCWILERHHGYTTKNSGAQSTTPLIVLAGGESGGADLLARASALAKAAQRAEKQKRDELEESTPPIDV